MGNAGKAAVCAAGRKIWAFVRGDAVLSVSIVLAVVSMFFVPPGPAYVAYIDWDTLALLFSLMAVVKGFQSEGFFEYIGSGLLKRTRSTRSMAAVLVFLPFFCSTVITNDVSLITFVPFAVSVLRMARQEALAVPLIILQTLAANLGSMLTPMGNPQNLYLYAQSGMGFLQLCGIMLPYVLLSALCLGGAVLLRRPRPIPALSVEARPGRAKSLAWCAAGLLLCLLGIFNLVPDLAVAAVILAALLFWNRKLLRNVDYALLGTFAAFFIFIGNLSTIPSFQNFLSGILAGHVVPVSVLASQVISNVPAALLLSGFTSDWSGLLIGTNLGGLGTLIASMASLISYKQLAREFPEKKKRYFLWFTVCNVALLLLLLLEYALLSARG